MGNLQVGVSGCLLSDISLKRINLLLQLPVLVVFCTM